MGQGYSSNGHLKELQRIQDLLDCKQKIKSSEIAEIYGASILLGPVISFLKDGKHFVVDGEDKTLLAFKVKSETYPKLQRVLEPLLAYWLRAQNKYRQKPELKFLSLDTLRYIDIPRSWMLMNLELKICGQQFSGLLFETSILFIMHNQDSEGIRIPVLDVVKQEILKRKYCYICEQRGTEIGHIRSVEHGGLSVKENLVLLCTYCNRSMGSMHLYEYLTWQQKIEKIPENERKFWAAIVVLTERALVGQPGLRELSLKERFLEFSKIF